MKKLSLLLMVALASVAWSQSRYSVRENETIRQTLEFSSGAGTKVLEIDNVTGSIHVTGYDGRTVEMVANKSLRAETQEKMQAAKQEVKLEISDKSDTIRIYADEPSCNCRERSSRWRNSRWRDPGYRVEFDFEVRVPRQTKLYLRTINDGDIKVENTAGDYDVENINGGVQMLDMSGSGRAYALNGEMKVTFVENPKADSYFGSLNGDVSVAFKPDLSADLRFKTFNGEVYTDFPLTFLPNASPTGQRRDGRIVYKGNGFSGYRVGKGGPEIKFEGFNGNIRVLGKAN